MAELIQPTSSASDWNRLYLKSFKIKIKPQRDSTVFFEVAELPDPATVVSDAILTATSCDRHNQDKETYRFIRCLKRVSYPSEPELPVDDFATAVLSLMGYDPPGYVVVRNVNMGFLMGHVVCVAQSGICVMDENEILLVSQENKGSGGPVPEAQLVSKAIAAFCHNNLRRSRCHGMPELKSRMMYGFSMYGTFPTFYKIPITQELVDCVSKLQTPDFETEVSSHVPSFPSGIPRGMLPLDNRRNALQFFLAFKALVLRDCNP